MKRDTTLYLYELVWMLPSVAIPVGMLAALLGLPSAPILACQAMPVVSIPPKSPSPPLLTSPE